MKKIFLLAVIILCGEIFAQDASAPKSLLTQRNVKLFADNLFCQRDFLRSIAEYENYLKYCNDDTVKFKIALSYSYMQKYSEAAAKFKLIDKTSNYYQDAYYEYYKNEFLDGNYEVFKTFFTKDTVTQFSDTGGIKKLSYASLLMQDDKINISEKDFLSAFNSEEQPYAGKFYLEKTNPGYKKPLKAALLSAIVPGLGKIYAGELGDGIFSFTLWGLSEYLAVSNIKHKHWARALIFSGTSALFYFSSIYGSAAQAQIYNAKVDFNFNVDFKSFLSSVNYFLPKEPDFCK
jgi:hypothetical protein